MMSIRQINACRTTPQFDISYQLQSSGQPANAISSEWEVTEQYSF
jgi:hypothetical protein